MIRVLVKASSAVVKAGLQGQLRRKTAFRVVEDVAEEPWRMESESLPDVLLVETATLTDLAARQAIEWASAGGRVVLMVRHPAAEPVAQALRAGVRAVLPSVAAEPEIAAAIEAAAAGLVVFAPDLVETLLPGQATAAADPSAGPVEVLTPRELEVLRLLAIGLGNKEIAGRLKISDHTVKFHVASIMGKLGAASRTEAVTLGIRHGLIMI